MRLKLIVLLCPYQTIKTIIMKTGILKTLSGDTKYVSRKESRGYIFRNVNNGNDFNGYWSTEERLIQDAKRNGLKIINNQ